jgi:hypothetical protein
MRLVEVQRDPRDYRAYLVPEIEADELIGDEEPSADEAATPDDAALIVEEPEPAEIAPPPEEAFFAPEPEVVEIQPAEEPAISDSPPGEGAIAESSLPAPETGKAEESAANRPDRTRKARASVPAAALRENETAAAPKTADRVAGPMRAKNPRILTADP